MQHFAQVCQWQLIYLYYVIKLQQTLYSSSALGLCSVAVFNLSHGSPVWNIVNKICKEVRVLLSQYTGTAEIGHFHFSWLNRNTDS